MGGKYSVLIEGETLSELRSEVALIHNELSSFAGPKTPEAEKSAPASESEVAVAKPGKKPAKKEEAPVAPPAEEEKEEEANIFGEEAAPPVEEKKYTKAQVKEVLQKVITKLVDKGIKKGVEILGTFGVKSLTVLPEDKYAAFVAACEKVL